MSGSGGTDSRLAELGARIGRAQDILLSDADTGTSALEREHFLDAADAQDDARKRSRVGLLFLAATLPLALLLVWWLRSSEPPMAYVGSSRAPHMAGAWLAASSESLPVFFSNGSNIELDPDARARIVALTPDVAALTLEMGQLRAWLSGREPQAWQIDTGPFTVRGSQTQFLLYWDPEAQLFEITLSQGAVTVEGPILGESKLVESGHSLRVSVPDALAVLTAMAQPGTQLP